MVSLTRKEIKMSNNLTFNEALVFCSGAQENKDVAGWRTMKEYESFIPNPKFDI